MVRAVPRLLDVIEDIDPRVCDGVVARRDFQLKLRGRGADPNPQRHGCVRATRKEHRPSERKIRLHRVPTLLPDPLGAL
jgi:hypothetical protein